MVRQRSRKIMCDGSPGVWKGFLCTLLLILWIFSFFNTSSASQISHQSDRSSLIEDHIDLCDAKVDASSHHPYHSHFPDLHPEGSYEGDEKELEDNVDGNGKAISKAFTVHHSMPAKVASTAIIPPDPHRRSVALFILFHSWKSDLS